MANSQGSAPISATTRAKASLSQAAFALALLVGLVLAGVAILVGSKLVSIENRANETRAVVIPKAVSQQRQALAAESITKYAAEVVFAPEPDVRMRALAAAEDIAATLLNANDGHQRELIEQAIAAIRTASSQTERAHDLGTEIARALARADGIVQELDDNLASIAEDSAFEVEELIEVLGEANGVDLQAIGRDFSTHFQRNAASQIILVKLRDSRALLAATLIADSEEALKSGEARFVAIVERLQAVLDNLPGTGGDFEYLPPIIKSFADLVNVFELGREALTIKTDAQVQRAAALAAVQNIAELSASLSSNAAQAAIGGIGVIADGIGTIGDSAVGALAFMVVFFVVVGWLGRRELLAPLVRASDVLDRLSSGSTDVEMPPVRIRELDAIRKSIESFRTARIRMQEMATAQVEQEKRAKDEKREAVLQLADDFEDSVKQVVEAVASGTTEMQTTAETMATTAEETSRQATAASAATDQASTNCRTVSAATEEMAAAINEIAQHVAKSSDMAMAAVDEAGRTNATVESLAEGSQKIGEVVELISDIASQTNLLALNATIEAARAGEAGKGFAVVASEVKSLASQTAKATDEIASQIGAIQSATTDAVAAIKGIGEKIGEMEAVSTQIAAAIEEQGAATAEISRSSQEVATGTQAVSSNVSGVNEAASESGSAASRVLGAAGKLSKHVEALRAEVDKFLAEVRAA